ncbi:MAG: nitroreductase family protein [Bacteroidales bacterium]|nr:nitroreductase family protein [Bacteroidales bacterium]
MSEKKPFFHFLSDISKIHHRAAFTDVAKHTNPKQSQFLKLAQERYSCRAFKSTPITEEELASVLEAGRLAPTAKNQQPVHLWVIKSPEGLEKLKQITPYSYDAPIAILVGCKPEEAWVRKYDGKNGAEIDAAIVATHIMLEAAALNLGSVWVGSFDPAKLKELYPETAGWEPVAILPIGYPATGPGPNHGKRKDWWTIVSNL